MSFRASLVLSLLLAAGLLASCRARRAEVGPVGACVELARTGKPIPRPVVMILADTLRRDRLGVYGGAARTPHLDAFAARGIIFDAAWSQAPWTKPSVATLFTGLYPSQHRVLSQPELRALAGEGTAATDSDVLDDASRRWRRPSGRPAMTPQRS
jgi:hypothetical protein